MRGRVMRAKAMIMRGSYRAMRGRAMRGTVRESKQVTAVATLGMAVSPLSRPMRPRRLANEMETPSHSFSACDD